MIWGTDHTVHKSLETGTLVDAEQEKILNQRFIIDPSPMIRELGIETTPDHVLVPTIVEEIPSPQLYSRNLHHVGIDRHHVENLIFETHSPQTIVFHIDLPEKLG